ncbi:MAG TPA: lytic transglycosylase domain-containing protein [Candidatus Binataceae bacterium]
MITRTAALLAIAWFALTPGAVALAQATPAAHRERVHAQRVDTQRLLGAVGRLYSLDPDLLAAIASVESGGNINAVSPKGAEGLMQLMPGTAMRFGILDPLDPVSNTLGAARFLNFLRQYRLARGDGALSLPEVLAAYNAGEGAVDKYGGIPPYAETRHYVRKVLVTYLFGDAQSALANRIRALEPAPEPVVMREQDPIEKLTEIQRLRALAISREQADAVPGYADETH